MLAPWLLDTNYISISMIHVYLDWNVFDRIEKLADPTFHEIEKLIQQRVIITPYSNAHINDLVRGYERNSTFVKAHLETLKRLTDNLCLVQYWGQKNTTWHYRDVVEFFNSALEDIENSSGTFANLIDWDETGLWDLRLSLLRSQRLPVEFKQIYEANAVFTMIFPKSRIEMNMLALCEDLFDFSKNAKKDFSLYKTLRGYVNQSRLKFKQQPKVFREIDKTMAGVPTHLNFDETWDKYVGKIKTSYNPAYQMITDTYYKIDFKGFKADDKFANLIDDSLHVFYGAHCEYFVTIDDKCHYKATEVYKKLKISTKSLKLIEFLEDIKIRIKHS